MKYVTDGDTFFATRCNEVWRNADTFSVRSRASNSAVIYERLCWLACQRIKLNGSSQFHTHTHTRKHRMGETESEKGADCDLYRSVDKKSSFCRGRSVVVVRRACVRLDLSLSACIVNA